MAKEDVEVVQKRALDNRKEYVLRANHEHLGIDEDGDPQNYKGGDKVLLTLDQYKSFGDKFETLEDKETREQLQKEANDANLKLAEITQALAEKGLSLDDLLKGNTETLKKPDKDLLGVGLDNADVTGKTAIPEARPENELVAGGEKKPAAATDDDKATTNTKPSTVAAKK